MPTLRLRFTAVTFALFWLVLAAVACAQTDAPVIFVTATVASPVPSGEPALPNPFRPTPTPIGPTATALQPTPNPTIPPRDTTEKHTVEAGDTLSSLAAQYGTSMNAIMALNPGVNESTTLFPGQELQMPGRPAVTTPNFKIIPDSELINSPGVRGFDVAAYIRFQPGFVRVYSEENGGRLMSGAEIIQFVANSASVNPRLLLALLEYRSGWITNPVPNETQILYPMGYVDQRVRGLLNQLDWAARQLNAGYYGWRTRGLTTLIFDDRSRLAYSAELNAGTVGVQHYLARSAGGDRGRWERDVSPDGFFTTYMALFGDPFRYAVEPLVPADLQQPELQFPFGQNEIWFLTSGPHGGWDRAASGWAAVDFAPPKPPDELVAVQGNCYVSPAFSVAMAPGMIVRSGDGAVVLDLDMDGDERTGWTILYLHIADKDRIAAGTVVQAGQAIGHPSCEGFYLNSLGTHIHIARRYNGEWIVADCNACAPGVAAPHFVMTGWTVKGYPGQVYQGWLEKDGQIRRAEQGRDDPSNQVFW